jgi:hypothetical protein
MLQSCYPINVCGMASKNVATKEEMTMPDITMIREDNLPTIFRSLFDAVNSLVEEYNSSRNIKLDVYSHPYIDFKVRRDPLPDAVALTVNLSSDWKSFEVQHWRLASHQSESEAQTRKIIPAIEGDGEVRFRYEDGEPISVEEMAQSLMQSFFD